MVAVEGESVQVVKLSVKRYLDAFLKWSKIERMVVICGVAVFGPEKVA